MCPAYRQERRVSEENYRYQYTTVVSCGSYFHYNIVIMSKILKVAIKKKIVITLVVFFINYTHISITTGPL